MDSPYGGYILLNKVAYTHGFIWEYDIIEGHNGWSELDENND